jgi:hypothetical protein
LDAGIVYSTKRHIQGTGRPTEIRAVGGWFHDYLRGYAGFGVALSFVLLLLDYYSDKIGNLLPYLDDISWMFGLPIIIALTTIPAHILLDVIREHRISYTRKVANKLGITSTDLSYNG